MARKLTYPSKQKKALARFWRRFEPYDAPAHLKGYMRRFKGRPYFQCRPTKKQKIDALIYTARLQFRSLWSHVGRRKDFDTKGRLFRKGTPCWCCGEPHTVRHHLILLSRGGTNDRENIVPLCDNCHSEIHPWMSPSSRAVAELDKQATAHLRAIVCE